MSFALIAGSCVQKDQFDIDTSDIEVNIEIQRLDKDLFELDPAKIEEETEYLINKYGEFFELYNGRIINLGSPYKKEFPELLTGFVTDYTMNKVYQETKQVFPDLEPIEKEIEDGFKRYKYYFPEKLIPAVYSYIGGFNQSIVVADSIIGIGLDKYLGVECEFYNRLQTPNYLKQNMRPELIPVDVIKSWAITEFVYNDSMDNLVNNMIYHGKIQYLLDAVYPNIPDTLKFGFTGEQMRWCIANENQMWNYLIEEKLLFSTDYMLINKHINPAPFTSGYPNESPGRASVWLGWKIVQKYMQRNNDLTVHDLMFNNNYQEILSSSRYEP
jgi:gliding motility-associated lipoprotein GldB